YFTQVRIVKGMAVAWQTKTSLAPVGKMPQVFEAELFLEEGTISSAPSLANTESLVSALEPWQEGPKVHIPEPSVQGEEHGERSNAATLEWLVTCKHGFHCVAYCHVFESREALVVHTEHGMSQGFSCHVFSKELLESSLQAEKQAGLGRRRERQGEGKRTEEKGQLRWAQEGRAGPLGWAPPTTGCPVCISQSDRDRDS
uniref:Uncharacterized protein n=1 Tax=Loxodonta africana TaxID=9785 RepID=G3UI32_LOXAF